jgi:hypothetical protein
LSGVALAAAFFTKETAIFDPPVACIMLVYMLRKPWIAKRNIIQYGVWLGAFLVWFLVRSGATLQSSFLTAAQVTHDFIHRLPAIFQYTGKIFLPVNLSVFPILEDTRIEYGFAAVVLLMLIVFLAKGKDLRPIISGLGIFILLLLPVLLVPSSLNEQLFEHRLYLPIIGILIIVPQTILFRNKLSDKQLFWAAIALACILAIENIARQSIFNDPISFWTSAESTSPHSAYAVMMLGEHIEEQDKVKSYALIRRAYDLKSDEKYINFYYGRMLQNEDSVQASEKYLLKEKSVSGYYECDFFLARVEIEKRPPDEIAAAAYMERYLTKDPSNPQGNNNLLLIYLQSGQKEKALNHLKHMQDLGIQPPVDLVQKINAMP